MIKNASGGPSIQSQFHSEKRRFATITHAAKAVVATTPMLALATRRMLFISRVCLAGLMSAMGGKGTFTILSHGSSMSPLAAPAAPPSKSAGCIPSLLVAGLLAAFIFSCERRDQRLAIDVSSVRQGTSKAQAIAALGTPSWEGRCGSYGITPLRAGCASELGYRSWLAPLKPVYRIVQLDNRDRVISSDLVVSP